MIAIMRKMMAPLQSLKQVLAKWPKGVEDEDLHRMTK